MTSSLARRTGFARRKARGAGGPPAEPVSDPQSIMGSNLRAWFRADEVVDTSLRVSEWTNKATATATADRDLIQVTGANQPLLEPTGGPNGTPSILFDQVRSDSMAKDNDTNLFAAAGGNLQLWMVAKNIDSPSGGAFLEVKTAIPQSLVQRFNIGLGGGLRYQGIYVGAVSCAGINSLANVLAPDVFQLYVLEWDGGATAEWFIDNVSQGTAAITGTTQEAISRLFMGTGGTLGASIAEFFITDSHYTVEQRAALTAYIAERYGL